MTRIEDYPAEVRSLIAAALRIAPYVEDEMDAIGEWNMGWRERVAYLGLLRAARRFRR